MSKVATNQDVKKLNRLNTLKAILTHGKISQPALAKLLGHSGPTVLQNVKELSSLGLVQEAGDLNSTGGRKARAYAPIADAKLSLGIEITKNHIGIVMIDLLGQILFYQRISQRFALQDDYFKLLGLLCEQVISKVGCDPDKIAGIGVSLPGIVDTTAKKLISSHVLAIWDVSTDNFSRYLNLPCFFINDANAAGLAENHRLHHSDHLVYVSLSNSVGGAILHSDQLYLGDTLRSGEFGHMTLIPQGKACYCGKLGCFDAYCNAELLSSQTNGNLEAFFKELADGNPEFALIWQQYLENLAVAVNNLHMVFDCDIMIGGYVGSYLPKFAPKFREMLAERNTFAQDSSYLKYCSYKTEASAIGAALLPLEDFMENLCL